MTSAKRGVIYFSMGSIVKGASIPNEQSLAMLRAFGRLEGYKVLWKWEDELPAAEIRPDNVMFVSWMPQFDVLSEYIHIVIIIVHYSNTIKQIADKLNLVLYILLFQEYNEIIYSPEKDSIILKSVLAFIIVCFLE